ncbi:MAG: mandelate racemase/muconate lactonizing enzyme family protein [Jatrophihabitans sp.]
MKIAEVRTYPVRVQAEASYLGTPPDGTATAYFTRAPWRSLYSAGFESMLVKITTDDGLVGWGEALAPVGPQISAAVVDLLLTPALLGEDPTAVRPLASRLSGLMRERGHLVGHQADALAAVDVALWDLAGRAAGLPVADLLGGAFRRQIPYYISGLPRPDDAARVELMASWVADGQRRVKLHLGQGVAADLATFDAVAAVHPDLQIAVDAHWAYTGSEATRLGRALDERGAWFLEAPLQPEDLAGHRELAADVITPIAVGETLRNRFEFAQWFAARGMDIAQPDVGRTGITEAIVIAGLASAAFVPVAPHHSVGLGVVLAAGLHVAAAVENLAVFEFQPDTTPVGNGILRAPVERGGAGFVLPDGPGLGVEVDEAAVQAAVIG